MMTEEYYLAERVKDLQNEVNLLRASYMNLEQEYKELEKRYELLVNSEKN